MQYLIRFISEFLKLRCVITLNGANVKDKKYNFDLSILESDYITDKSKREIITEFNAFLEKKD